MKIIKKELRLNPTDPIDNKIISFLDKCGHKRSAIMKACLVKLADTIPIDSSKDANMVLNLISMMSFAPSSIGITPKMTISRPKTKQSLKRTLKDNPLKEIPKETPKETLKVVPKPPKEVVMSDEDVMKELGTQENSSSFITDEEQELFERMRALDPDLDTGGD